MALNSCWDSTPEWVEKLEQLFDRWKFQNLTAPTVFDSIDFRWHFGLTYKTSHISNFLCLPCLARFGPGPELGCKYVWVRCVLYWKCFGNSSFCLFLAVHGFCFHLLQMSVQDECICFVWNEQTEKKTAANMKVFRIDSKISHVHRSIWNNLYFCSLHYENPNKCDLKFDLFHHNTIKRNTANILWTGKENRFDIWYIWYPNMIEGIKRKK